MAAVRNNWIFRTAAVICILFGVFWLVDATLFDRYASLRPYLLGMGVAAIAVGVMLFRRMKVAIALSAIAAAIVSVSAAVAAPQMHGPGILVLAGLAVVTGLYAALAARELFDRGS